MCDGIVSIMAWCDDQKLHEFIYTTMFSAVDCLKLKIELFKTLYLAMLFFVVGANQGRFTPRGRANFPWGRLHKISAFFGLEAGLYYTLE